MGSEDRSEDGPAGLPDCGDSIDPLTFEQILEMDDDDDREFSKSIVTGFFEQAEQTFTQMDDSVKSGDLKTLSELGHFLKGSSATLGLSKVKDSCEKIQHYGSQMDAEGIHPEPDDAKSLSRIKQTLVDVKRDYADAKKRLEAFYQS